VHLSTQTALRASRTRKAQRCFCLSEAKGKNREPGDLEIVPTEASSKIFVRKFIRDRARNYHKLTTLYYMKKLTRSETDKVIGGVLGGFAEYINVDTTVVRLGYVLLSLITCFSGVLFYIIAWIIIPIKVSHETKHNKKVSDEKMEKGTIEEKLDVSHETKVENLKDDVSHETEKES
jgi:phage shock protein PspC (stress-responsive transcriptional regulator)